jgi:N6-L-threonylcarbamoyladenine synthase
VLQITRGEDGDIPDREDLAAAFQESVVDSLVTKAVKAATDNDARRIVLAGGVAANTLLRKDLVERSPLPVIVPPAALCTDNGAMIAAAAYRRLAAGARSDLDLDIEPGLKIG